MKPLNIPPGPGIPKGLVIPVAELTERFARSGGPGGQGVNTTDSKVQLSVDIAELSVLSDVHRRRALQNLSHRLDGTTLTVSVTTQRSPRYATARKPGVALPISSGKPCSHRLRSAGGLDRVGPRLPVVKRRSSADPSSKPADVAPAPTRGIWDFRASVAI